MPRRKRNGAISDGDLENRSGSLLNPLPLTEPDKAVEELIGEALDQTMAEIEARMETKVRKGYQQENRLSPNMVYAKFFHSETRPVDGIPAPHYHIHVFGNWPRKSAFPPLSFRILSLKAPEIGGAFSRIQHSTASKPRLTPRTKTLGSQWTALMMPLPRFKLRLPIFIRT